MTMARQTPGLVLPFINTVPTSFTYTKGEDKTLTLARTLVEMGLGSVELWKRFNGNISRFIRDSLAAWLSDVGGDELNDQVNVDFAVFDQLDGYSDSNAPEGSLYALLDTPDGCGFISVGDELDLLEKEHPGLGRAFYLVLIGTMNQWMDVYDSERTRYFLDRWKESIEMDIDEGDSMRDALKNYLQQYLKERMISTFPISTAAIPECAKNLTPQRVSFCPCPAPEAPGAVATPSGSSPYSQWMRVKQPKVELRTPATSRATGTMGRCRPGCLLFGPTIRLRRRSMKRLTGMNECSHAPTWIATFNPADKKDVRRILDQCRGVCSSQSPDRQTQQNVRSTEGNRWKTTSISAPRPASSCVRLYSSTAATEPETARTAFRS
jgi:hypothetical protein